MGIAADRTGVGAGAIQSLAEHGVHTEAAVFIHGGHNDKPDAAGLNFFNVAQRDLIGYAQGLAEEDERDRLKFNPLLQLAEALSPQRRGAVDGEVISSGVGQGPEPLGGALRYQTESCPTGGLPRKRV